MICATCHHCRKTTHTGMRQLGFAECKLPRADGFTAYVGPRHERQCSFYIERKPK